MLTLNKLIQWLVLCSQSEGYIFSNSDHSETREGVSYVHFQVLPFGLAMNYFLADLKGCLVVVRMDNNSVVSYLNHRRGMCSSMLERCRLVRCVMLCSQYDIFPLRKVKFWGGLNHRMDHLLKHRLRPWKCSLHHQAVNLIEKFGRAELVHSLCLLQHLWE